MFRQKVWAWRWPLVVLAITLLGLVTRVCMAWAMRYPACNGDFSIIGLMVRHMANGTDFPVFAYGVAYMGSLEPALAVLLAKLLRVEVSAFIVNLSPALVGTLLLPLLYLFGRDAGTRRAGVLAMLFCLVGSDSWLHNSVAARGGYMNVMVLGVLSLWLAARIAARESQDKPVAGWSYFWLGLAAGVAWWVTQLAVVFLFAALVVLLVGVRWRMVRVGMIPALLGVILGSLPWWVWNIGNQWGSLNFGGGMAKVPFSMGIVYFGHMFLRLIEMDPFASWRGAPRLIILLGLIAGFMVLLIRERWQNRQDTRFYFRLAVLMLAAFMIYLYSTSGFSRVNTTRYLLPLFPALAVVIAVTCDWLLERVRLPIGWVVFVLMIPPHLLLLPRMFDGVATDRERWAMAQQLQGEVAPLCDGNFVGDLYTTHWLNFASQESLCVASLPMERYAPYARRVELAERRAYINGYGNLGAFLKATQSAGRQARVGSMSIDYGLIPPSNKWRYVEPGDVARVRDHQGQECKSVLLDSVLDSSWSTVLMPKSVGSLTFSFGRPIRLCGLRLMSLYNLYAWKLSVEGRTGVGGVWTTVMPPLGVTSYFWSGPYVMIDGIQYFQELRIPAPDEGFSEIRLIFHGPPEGEEPVKLGEILLLETEGAGPGNAGEGWESAGIPVPMVTRCVESLQQAGLQRFYAPRWLAERVAVATTNYAATKLSVLFDRTIQEMAASDSRDPIPLKFTEDTGLFMDTRDVPRSRAVLEDAELEYQEFPLGAITLVKVRVDQHTHAGSSFARVFWTEHGCFGANFSKEKAQLLYESALAEARLAPKLNTTLDQLREAIRIYPAHYPARTLLVSNLMANGLAAEAASNAAMLALTTQPKVPGPVRFENGAELLGVTVDERVKIGQSLNVSYFWKCRSDVNPEKWAVFVHINNNSGRFQDDHVLLTETPMETIRYQPFPEIMVETRSVRIPETVLPGDYQMHIGLLDRRTGLRLATKTRLSHKENAVEMPINLKVIP
jgi:hypothetical protein